MAIGDPIPGNRNFKPGKVGVMRMRKGELDYQRERAAKGPRIPGTRIKAVPGMKFGPGTGGKAGTRGAGKGGAGDM